MKIFRWGDDGRERPGMIDRQGERRDLGGVIDDWRGAALSSGQLRRLHGLDARTLPRVPAQARLGPCIAGVGKIICVGLNYRDHAREAGMALPTEPILFLKAASAITGPFDAIEIPPGAAKVDWEVELGIVIGQDGRYLEPGRVMEHVAGYCLFNDVSERAYQLERGGQWDKGKCADTFAPLGPYLVTPDEITDVQDLPLWLEVDGVRRQDGSTRDMIFGVAELLAYVSRFMSLQAGDIIATGTPAGVGMGLRPPVYLAPGQRVRAGIGGLGEQDNPVVAAGAGL
ncbi:fumarylacetoacetate hydrolase family protein [Sodalis sp. C49]|uniref:fumarylacetoacetate hydrolase family protein n=1 Tax=Sodalis sp. C49 TaxID=3228929 RepID=UPI003965CBC3